MKNFIKLVASPKREQQHCPLPELSLQNRYEPLTLNLNMCDGSIYSMQPQGKHLTMKTINNKKRYSPKTTVDYP